MELMIATAYIRQYRIAELKKYIYIYPKHTGKTDLKARV